MDKRTIGIIVLILVVVLGGGYYWFTQQGGSLGDIVPKDEVVLKGYIGSEKSHFLANEAVQKKLKVKYGLVIDYSKAGSIEMSRFESYENVDFLWPSSQVAMELFKILHPEMSIKSEIMLNSPIVVYSWDIVTESLVNQNIVALKDNTYYIVDPEKLLQVWRDGILWKDLGLEELYGKVSIVSTDPTKSNSGNMFAGLVANLLHGDIVTEESLTALLPSIKNLITSMGYKEHSTGVLFEQYLRKGLGSYPLIIGYENQIVEFSLQNPDLWPRVKEKMRILYPEPTVWSSHPVIALNDNGKKLIAALEDPELQKLAWEQHGFRTGLIGVENDPEALGIEGVPTDITKVIPMPSPKVMETIINALEG